MSDEINKKPRISEEEIRARTNSAILSRDHDGNALENENKFASKMMLELADLQTRPVGLGIEHKN